MSWNKLKLDTSSRFGRLAYKEDVVGIKTATLVSRIYLYNWPIERALTTPVK